MFYGARNKKRLQMISSVVGILVIISMVAMYAIGGLF
jgi:hypothetical protein